MSAARSALHIHDLDSIHGQCLVKIHHQQSNANAQQIQLLHTPGEAEVAMGGLPFAVTLAHQAVLMVGGLPAIILRCSCSTEKFSVCVARVYQSRTTRHDCKKQEVAPRHCGGRCVSEFTSDQSSHRRCRQGSQSRDRGWRRRCDRCCCTGQGP